MSSEEVEAIFVTSFTGQYVRNNKSADQKNLRCFPTCREGGHCRLGFCGTPVVVQCTIRNPIQSSFSELSYVAYGDFVLQHCDKEPVGKKVADSVMQESTRSDNAPAKSLLRSSVKKVAMGEDGSWVTLFFYFNEMEHGWHYGWRCPKTKAVIRHSFRTRIYRCEGEMLNLQATVCSTPFLINSSRRCKLKHKLAAPKIEPRKGPDETGEGAGSGPGSDSEFTGSGSHPSGAESATKRPRKARNGNRSSGGGGENSQTPRRSRSARQDGHIQVKQEPGQQHDQTHEGRADADADADALPKPRGRTWSPPPTICSVAHAATYRRSSSSPFSMRDEHGAHDQLQTGKIMASALEDAALVCCALVPEGAGSEFSNMFWW